MRRATNACAQCVADLAFLSTLSLRRATAALMENTSWMRYFYPRSPCGERRHQEEVWSRMNDISIHALLAESDNDGRKVDYALRNFYPRSPCGERLPASTTPMPTTTFLSTLSLRRATDGDPSVAHIVHISIHALLAESDCQRCRYRPHHGHFYPRSPCGERPVAAVGATRPGDISIHALLAESDPERGW